MAVTSPFIWYPSGPGGSAYDLRKVYAWGDGPGVNQVTVRIGELGTAATVTFNKTAFENAYGGVVTPPENISLPVIAGTGYVGYTLTSTPGSWSSASPITYGYQWQRFTGGMWVDIPAATASSLVFLLIDEGVPIRMVESATNVAGTVYATSNTIEQWVPSDMGGSLGAWFDAFDSSTLTLAGSNVSQWRDKSGNARHASQGTGSLQPVYNATGMGGYPAVEANYDLLPLAGATWGPSQMNIGGVFQRGSQTNTSDSTLRVFASGTVGGTGDDDFRAIWVPRSSPAAGLSTNMFNASDSQATPANIAISDPTSINTPFIGYARLPNNANYANTRVFLNSSVGSTPIGPAAGGSSNTNNWALFGQTDGSSSAQARRIEGKASEFVFTTGSLGTTDEDKLQGYLAWRWRQVALLPPADPYKLVPPLP